MKTSQEKYFCPHCFTSGKGSSWSCGNNHNKNEYISSKIIRFPSKDASRSKWKEFVLYLESFWGYKNSKDSYWNDFRRKVKILKDNKKIE